MKNYQILFAAAIIFFSGNVIYGQNTSNATLKEACVKCKTDEVHIIPETPGTQYHVRSLMVFKKNEQRKSLADFSTKELLKIKKQARQFQCCTILMASNSHRDPATGSETEYLEFYFVRPLEPHTGS